MPKNDRTAKIEKDSGGGIQRINYSLVERVPRSFKFKYKEPPLPKDQRDNSPDCTKVGGTKFPCSFKL